MNIDTEHLQIQSADCRMKKFFSMSLFGNFQNGNWKLQKWERKVEEDSKIKLITELQNIFPGISKILWMLNEHFIIIKTIIMIRRNELIKK